jgi:hypothetical protein
MTASCWSTPAGSASTRCWPAGSPSTASRPADVTDVLVTHSRYDLAVNFPLFPAAAIWISEPELTWAAGPPARL